MEIKSIEPIDICVKNNISLVISQFLVLFQWKPKKQLLRIGRQKVNEH